MGLMLLGLSAGKCAVIIVRERIISEGNLKNFRVPWDEAETGYETDAVLLSL